MSEALSIAGAADGVLAAYEGLVALAEGVEDEWTYVTDLAAAWRARIEEVREGRGDEPLGPAAQAALDRAVDEVGLVNDPHRAIDWLSTFPQIVLIILNEPP